MKKKVIKTSFEKHQQRMKEDAFSASHPIKRLAFMTKLRRKMRTPGVNYSYRGMTVKV